MAEKKKKETCFLGLLEGTLMKIQVAGRRKRYSWLARKKKLTLQWEKLNRGGERDGTGGAWKNWGKRLTGSAAFRGRGWNESNWGSEVGN